MIKTKIDLLSVTCPKCGCYGLCEDLDNAHLDHAHSERIGLTMRKLPEIGRKFPIGGKKPYLAPAKKTRKRGQGS